MALDSTPRMQPALRLNVGGVGFFGRGEPAQLFAAPVYPQSCAISPEFLVVIRAQWERRGPGGALFHVLKIHRLAYVAQVCKAVVGFVAVNVVNVLLWVFACHVQPRKPVGVMPLALKANDSIAKGNVHNSGDIANGLPAAEPDAPSKYTRFGIVVKKLAQALRGKIGLSHEALQLLIGQRPASVSALRPASPF